MRGYFIIALVFSNSLVFAQDYEWWNTKHNWDGVTHWTEYMIIAPGFMGPNALPVPEVNKGVNPEGTFLDLSVNGHYLPGELTTDFGGRLYLNLYDNNVGLEISMVGFEIYRMDSTVRDMRRSRDKDGKGFSVGDVYVNTFIQLIRNKRKLPDAQLRIGLKTASGNNLEAARFTDAPAYFFDVSIGKEFTSFRNKKMTFRPFASAGFYAWQTYSQNNHQNDAYMYGVGMQIGTPRIEWTNSIVGYSGYLNKGDRPLIVRSEVFTRSKSMFRMGIQLEQGIRDHEFTSLRFTVRTKFAGNKKSAE